MLPCRKHCQGLFPREVRQYSGRGLSKGRAGTKAGTLGQRPLGLWYRLETPGHLLSIYYVLGSESTQVRSARESCTWPTSRNHAI
jgi:hypothetical protein